MKITVFGITKNDETLRPQNWPHRIACIFSPRKNGVSRYTSGIHIGYENEIRYLSVENPPPDFLAYLEQFAKMHNLRVKNDI